MNKLNSVYNLVPPDYLTYSNILEKFCPFSDKQITRLMEVGVEAGMDTQEITLFINEMIISKVMGLIADRIIKGEVKVGYNGEELVYSAA